MIDGLWFDCLMEPKAFNRGDAKRVCRSYLAAVFPAHFAGGPKRTRAANEDEPPLELLDRASDARALGRCMERLSPSQRQSVALAFFDGLSHAEVAERLREPLGTVKARIRRGLLKLRDSLHSQHG